MSLVRNLLGFAIALYGCGAENLQLESKIFDESKNDCAQITSTDYYAIDGDTVRLSSGSSARLLYINAPELDANDCYAQWAQEYLATRLGEASEVTTIVPGPLCTDVFERKLAIVYVDGVDMNRELIELGYACTAQYQHFEQIPPAYSRAQSHAIEDNLGLWRCFAPNCDLN